MTTDIGTCTFRSAGEAVSYYATYGNDKAEVMRKIHDKEIKISKSPQGAGYWDGEGRWHLMCPTLRTVSRLTTQSLFETASAVMSKAILELHEGSSKEDKRPNSCILELRKVKREIESYGSGYLECAELLLYLDQVANTYVNLAAKNDSSFEGYTTTHRAIRAAHSIINLTH